MSKKILVISVAVLAFTVALAAFTLGIIHFNFAHLWQKDVKNQAGSAQSKVCQTVLHNDSLSTTIKQTKNTLFSLPTLVPDKILSPKNKTQVFAGWWDKGKNERYNKSKVVKCNIDLYAHWISQEQNNAAGTGVPILMYHQFTTKIEGEPELTANYIYYPEFDKQLAWLKSEKFYLPDWNELDAFIDGELYLPPKSVIISDDDADASWFDLGVPIVRKYQMLSTSFVITSARTQKAPSKFIMQRSHSHDMHRAGDNTLGLITNLEVNDIKHDLLKSAKILGAKEVFAYPYGHRNEHAIQALKESGFKLAVTVDYGKVYIGADKFQLPRIRVSYGETLEEFKTSVLN